MRYVALSLLLLNLGYFAYQQWWPAATDRPSAALARDVRVKGLTLSSEADKSRPTALQLSQVVSNPMRGEAAAVPGEGESDQCQAIGPLTSLFAGQSLLEKLRAYDLDVSLKAVDLATQQASYRVLLPPAKTVQDAFRKVRELKSNNIDSYVISQGSDANGISLGLFSSQRAAERVREQMRTAGYQVEIREIPGINRQFWLFAKRGDAPLDIAAGVWAVMREEYPGIEQQLRPCPQD